MVLALLVLLSVYIWPVSDTIRLGKDLRGGFSLQYQLLIDQSQNADEVMNTTITVLKDRIDPTGTMDLSMVPQGQRPASRSRCRCRTRTSRNCADEYLQMLDDIRAKEITGRDFRPDARDGGRGAAGGDRPTCW